MAGILEFLAAPFIFMAQCLIMIASTINGHAYVLVEVQDGEEDE